MIDEPVEVDEMDLISAEDRELLTVYQQSFDDEKVDIDLVACLLHRIHTSAIEGNNHICKSLVVKGVFSTFFLFLRNVRHFFLK